MRDFLDGILAFIGSESLTDPEWAGVPEGLSQVYTQEVYDALKAVLDTRESVSETHERLKAMFRAQGLVVDAEAVTPQSNILIGEEL